MSENKAFARDISILLIIILSLFFLASCEPQKRINRILNRNPELKRDTTILIHDTLVTKAFSFDTIYNFKHSKDTIVINKNNVQVKIFHYKDTVFLKTNVKADTVIKTLKIPYRQIIYTIDNKKKMLMFWLGTSVAFFLIVVMVFIKFYFFK